MSRGLQFSMQAVREDIKRADALVKEENFDEAIAILERVVAMLKQGGYGHATIVWRLAIAHDLAGYLDHAYRLIGQAQAAEPGSPDIEKSRRIIARRLREVVAAGEPPELRASYELLRNTGEADAACHLAMARVLVAEQQLAEAERLLGALTTLQPSLPEAWALRGEVATALGDDALATTCSTMAATGGPDEPTATQPGATA